MEDGLLAFVSCLLEEREALEDALYSDKHNPPPQDQSGWKQSHVATLLASIRPVYGSSELDRRRESAVKELLAVGIPPADAVARCAQARDAHERLIGYCIEAAGQHNSVLDGDINTDHAAAIEALCDLLPVVEAPHTAPDPKPEGVADTFNRRDWIEATKAAAQLDFIHNGTKGLQKYANDNPDKLRLQPDPEHGRRLLAHGADVARLGMEHNEKQFEEMDSIAGDAPPKKISGAAMRQAALRLRKQQAGE